MTPEEAQRRKEWRQYLLALSRLQRNLDKFQSQRFSEHGTRWIESQTAYWQRRIDELKANKPPGPDPFAE